MIMTYNNSSWGIERMQIVVTHGVGHIFGAPDEYQASTCSTAGTYGFLNVPNASCNNDRVSGDVSIMGEGSEQEAAFAAGNDGVSISTREAIGWRNPKLLGAGPTAVVDVVKTATAELNQYPVDPTNDTTPTFLARAGNVPFEPGGAEYEWADT